MLILCDRLTLNVCAELVRLRVRGLSGNRASSVQVLDPASNTVWHRTLRALMKLLGFNVAQAKFFAGHLKSSTGEAVSIAAIRCAQDNSVGAAESVIESSSFLSKLNAVWGRNTIRLHLAKSIWDTMLDVGSRSFVASALARDVGAEKAILLVARPHNFPESYLVDLHSNLELRFYSPGFGLKRTGRLYLILWLLRSHFKELKWRTGAQVHRLLRRQKSNGIDANDSASLLLIQESEISLDRSFRTQPHWLFESEARQQFQTYILEKPFFDAPSANNVDIEDQGIHLVSNKDIALTRQHRPALPVQIRLSKALRQCLIKSLFGGSGPQAAATVRLSQLFFVAIRMADFCRQANVKAFMTCENYYTEVDAVQLIASELGIHTLSYQFANTGNTGPISSTNGDSMFMISALYHEQYSRNGIRPDSLKDIGYPYETSFHLVRERAQKCRTKMEKAGAKFIICYFDENSTVEPYGDISPADHIRDLLALMQLVLEDPSVGLVVKTKLLRTSPRFIDEISAVRKSVEATGRYVELMHGIRRNIIFPAEAALSADLAIGQAVGSTAVLESALAGTRGILLNPYGITGANDYLYAKANIIYPSLAEALEAVRAFREGAPEQKDLGDWSPIIDQFDPVRDGQAGHRMRAALEQAVMGID